MAPLAPHVSGDTRGKTGHTYCRSVPMPVSSKIASTCLHTLITCHTVRALPTTRYNRLTPLSKQLLKSKPGRR